MRTIIAGGRDFILQQDHFAFLDALHAEHGITAVICGCARGADQGGADWANARGIPVVPMPADWNTHGKAAGCIRNRDMAHAADAAVLFPGGRGTANMRWNAEKLGLRVFEWQPPPRLKTLEEHNESVMRSILDTWPREVPNGIACPNCGKELVDADPSVTLRSHPPQKRVACKSCGWLGTRLCQDI